MEIAHNDLDLIKRKIEEIRNLDLITAEIDYIKDLLKPVMMGYVKSTPRIDPGFKIYRGRICHTLPSHVRDISYPPANLIKQLQRVNREGVSMFYGASDSRTPCFEMDLQPGDKFVVSEWVTTAPLIMNNIAYTATGFSQLNSDRTAPQFGDRSHPNFKKEENQIIDDFFSQEFIKKVPKGAEYLYKISIAIAEKHLHSEKKEGVMQFDGLFYPTVKMRANAENFAIKPEFIDKHVKLQKVDFAIVHERYAISSNDVQYKIEVLDSALKFESDGNISWDKPIASGGLFIAKIV